MSIDSNFLGKSTHVSHRQIHHSQGQYAKYLPLGKGLLALSSRACFSAAALVSGIAVGIIGGILIAPILSSIQSSNEKLSPIYKKCAMCAWQCTYFISIFATLTSIPIALYTSTRPDSLQLRKISLATTMGCSAYTTAIFVSNFAAFFL